jgi:hypothetical protein
MTVKNHVRVLRLPFTGPPRTGSTKSGTTACARTGFHRAGKKPPPKAGGAPPNPLLSVRRDRRPV